MANGKGDTPRPLSVSKDEFDAAWARTFGAKKADVCPPCPKCGERVSDVHFIASRDIPEGRPPDCRICRACGWNSGAGGI